MTDVQPKGRTAAVWFPVEKLVDWDKNPREKDPQHVEEVKALIAELGFGPPVVARNVGKGKAEIIAGHTRVEAARLLGMEEVPVRFRNDLTEAQAHALAVADNRQTEKGRWDLGLLPVVLEELDAAGLGVEGLGFTEEELEKLLAGEPDGAAGPGGGGAGKPDLTQWVPFRFGDVSALVSRATYDLFAGAVKRVRAERGDATPFDDIALEVLRCL